MAGSNGPRRLRRGDRLPAMVLPGLPDGAPVRFRDPARGAPVVLFVRSPDSEEAAELVRRVAAAADEFRLWVGRPLVVVPGDLADARRLALRSGEPSFPLLADAAGEGRRRSGVEPGTAAVVVADRWGVIYFADRTGTESELPATSEIVEWLRFLATQCPECGVPDEPGWGEWTP